MGARFVAIVTALILGACDRPAPEPARPVVRIAGSETVTHHLAPRLAETHERTVGGVSFEIVPGDSDDGFDALLSGRADLAASSRPHTPAEQEQAVANGTSLEADGARHIVAVDVVAVVVHPDNPVSSLTYDQIIGIFCTGTIDDWSFLGLEPAPIRALTRDHGSGTRALFEDFFCGPSGIHPGVEVTTAQAAQELVSADEAAVTFVTMSSPHGKVVGLRPDARGQALVPSQQNIVRGAYPLYRDLYLYAAGPARGEVRDFLDWIAAPGGQEVVDEAGFVPLFLRPERLDEPRPLRETLHFDAGSTEPNQRSAARLGLLVDELRARAGASRHIVLEGYADAREPDPVALSRTRAEKVRELLEAELTGLFFEIIPRGAASPIAPNTTPYGRLRNRRVAVYLADEEQGGGIDVVAEEDPP